MVDCSAVANQNGQDVSTFVQWNFSQQTKQLHTKQGRAVESLKIEGGPGHYQNQKNHEKFNESAFWREMGGRVTFPPALV